MKEALSILAMLPVAAIVAPGGFAEAQPAETDALKEAQAALQALTLKPMQRSCDCADMVDWENQDTLRKMQRHIAACVAGEKDINFHPYLDWLAQLAFYLPEGQVSRAVRALLQAGLTYGVQEEVASFRDAACVRLLIEAGAVPGEAEMLKAVRRDLPPEVMQTFIQAGASPHVCMPDGNPIICECCAMGSETSNRAGMVSVLLQAGVDPNTRDKDGKPLLALAQSPEVVRALFAAGADPKAVDNYGNNALFAGNNSCSVEVIRALIEGGVDFRAKNHRGESFLWDALAHDYSPDVVRLLLQLGLDPNERDGSDRPVLSNCSNGEVMEVMLAAGADPRALVDGEPLAHYLAGRFHPNLDVLRLLAQAGGDFSFPQGIPHLVNEQCERLLAYFSTTDPSTRASIRAAALSVYLPRLEEMAQDEALRMCGEDKFLREFADKLEALAEGRISAKDYPFIPAFCRTLRESNSMKHPLNSDLVDFYLFMLKEAGADINAKDSYGATGLHYMAYLRDHTDGEAWSLINLGADVKATDSAGLTPLAYAQGETARVLRSYGAKEPATHSAKLPATLGGFFKDDPEDFPDDDDEQTDKFPGD